MCVQNGQTIDLSKKAPGARRAGGTGSVTYYFVYYGMKIKSERAHGVVMEKLCSHIGSFPERKEYP